MDQPQDTQRLDRYFATHSLTQPAVSHDDPDNSVPEVTAEYFNRSLEEGVGGILFDSGLENHFIYNNRRLSGSTRN
jgi:hypothetical protein